MLVVPRADLAPALEAVRGGLPGRGESAPRQILLVAEQGELRVVTHNQAIHAEARLGVGAGELNVVAPAELAEIVPRLDETITLSPKETTLTVKSNGAVLRLGCFPVDGFPVMSFQQTGAPITLPAQDFRHALSFVQGVIPSADPRACFNGVLFQFSERALTLVGCDSLVLAVIRLGVGGPPGKSWILPTRAVAEILKLLRATDEETLELSLGAARLRFRLGKVTLTVACVDAAYPAWPAILARAKQGNHTIDADHAAFLGACERVCLVARDEPRIQLSYGAGQITLSTEKGGQAAEEKLSADCAHEGVVTFNRAQLRVAAAAIRGPRITLRIGEPHPPVLVTGAAKTECYVLSPVKN